MVIELEAGKYITAQEAAERLGVSYATVKAACHRGEILGAQRMGGERHAGMWVIPLAGLAAYRPKPMGRRKRPGSTQGPSA